MRGEGRQLKENARRERKVRTGVKDYSSEERAELNWSKRNKMDEMGAGNTGMISGYAAFHLINAAVFIESETRTDLLGNC